MEYYKPDKITEIHREYYNAGSNVISTNTFGVNPLKYIRIRKWRK